MDITSIENKIQEQHLLVRNKLEEHFQTLGIEIQDIYVDNKLVYNLGSSVCYIPDGLKYRVQVKVKTNYLFLTGAIDPNKDATKQKWYIVKRVGHRIGEWVETHPYICSGSLKICTKKFKNLTL